MIKASNCEFFLQNICYLRTHETGCRRTKFFYICDDTHSDELRLRLLLLETYFGRVVSIIARTVR